MWFYEYFYEYFVGGWSFGGLLWGDICIVMNFFVKKFREIEDPINNDDKRK